MHGFGAGDVAREEEGVVVEVGLAQAGVEVPDFVGGGLAAFPLLVTGVITLKKLQNTCVGENIVLEQELTVIHSVDGRNFAAQRLEDKRHHCVADIASEVQ